MIQEKILAIPLKQGLKLIDLILFNNHVDKYPLKVKVFDDFELKDDYRIFYVKTLVIKGEDD
ncbi:MAG: hypothetical protein LBT66_08040 [Methanobrevibacter sp.]|jgi:hypothetical protein|nr:hypothetical protein [Candidatus Methanovirga meridionalis]